VISGAWRENRQALSLFNVCYNGQKKGISGKEGNTPMYEDDTLSEFLDYLQSLWGKLSAISLLFPLSNQLLKLIATPAGFSPAQATTINTIACIFTILAIFVGKKQYYHYEMAHPIAAFAGGIIGAGMYVTEPLMWTGLPGLILYCGVFVCFTAAFTFLAVMAK
jgi:hypothetical protein